MREDPIAVLERELVQAARRRTAPRRERRILGGLAMAAALVVAMAIAAGALLLLGGHRHAPVGAGAGVPGRQALIDELGVLRRAQTRADRDALIRPRARFGTPDVPLIRRATVTPWGQPVFLVPVKPVAGRRQEALLVLIGRRNGFSECCATASVLRTAGIVNNAGRARFFAVVPDGVAKVRLGRLLMPVRDNVAAAQADPRLVGATPVILWLDAAGNVVRRIGGR